MLFLRSSFQWPNPEPVDTSTPGVGNECHLIARPHALQSPFAVTNDAGKDVLTLNVDAVTPAVLAVKDKDGHPELAQFAARPAGSVLGLTITADWFADGSGAVVFGDSAGADFSTACRPLCSLAQQPTTASS
jgi:hypothetical protein